MSEEDIPFAGAPPAPQVSIRRARPADAGLVHALVAELAEYEQLEHELIATEADHAAALFGPDPKVFAEILEWDGAPAGLALWFYNYSTFTGRHGIWLEDLFVRPAYRRRGLARAAFRHLARRCWAEGLRRFEWSVLDWNRPALEFYRAQGAVAMDGWTTMRVTGDALARLAGLAPPAEATDGEGRAGTRRE